MNRLSAAVSFDREKRLFCFGTQQKLRADLVPELGIGAVDSKDVPWRLYRAHGGSDAAYAAAAIISSICIGATTARIAAAAGLAREPILNANNCRVR